MHTKKVSPLLLRSLKYIPLNARIHALDLGSGSQRDSIHISKLGFKKTTAVDKCFYKTNSGIDFIQSKIEDYIFTPDTYSLINAQFVLSLNIKNIPSIIQCIYESLKNNGIFTFNLLGVEEEEIYYNTKINVFSENEIRLLLKKFSILSIEEKKYFGKNIKGINKNWHVFEVIATKS